MINHLRQNFLIPIIVLWTTKKNISIINFITVKKIKGAENDKEQTIPPK